MPEDGGGLGGGKKIRGKGADREEKPGGRNKAASESSSKLLIEHPALPKKSPSHKGGSEGFLARAQTAR